MLLNLIADPGGGGQQCAPSRPLAMAILQQKAACKGYLSLQQEWPPANTILEVRKNQR